MVKLTKKQAMRYKDQWQQVEKVQARELRLTPIFLKFKQLCFLMDSFRSVSVDEAREKESNKIRRRWTLLRKRLKNGRA